MARLYSKGERIKNYTIEKMIEDGEFSTSYSAFDETKTKVFFKVYKSPTGAYLNLFDPFIEQQRFLKDKLEKITTVETINELFEIKDNTFHCQVKEFIDGCDLLKYLAENNPDHEKRVLLAIMIVHALIQIHKAGIIHTDLKKEQIFVIEEKWPDKKIKIKITDFDFSRIPGKFEPAYPVTSPYYSSPEFFKDKKIEYASDVFSLGIILYELLCCENPYDADGPDDYMQKVLNYQVKERPNFLNPKLGGELSELIMQMLNPEKGNRPGLEEVYNSLTGKTSKKSSVSNEIKLFQEGVSFYILAKDSKSCGRSQLIGFSNFFFCSDIQFFLLKTDLGWKIKANKESVNPTYLNSTLLETEAKDLSNNDRIFIGNIRKKTGMELIVRLTEPK
jgi:serine/threonine protein kinase